jgi:hypothetical protein
MTKINRQVDIGERYEYMRTRLIIQMIKLGYEGRIGE